jgi:transposase
MKTIVSYWRMPEAIWRRLRKLIPKWHPSRKGGRPPLDPRHIANGIYYVMRTGCPWKAAPSQFGSGSSLHRYFQQWVEHGVFRKLWKQGLIEYDRRRGIAWRWQTLDTATNKAPLGGEKNREKPHGSRQTRRQAVGAHRRARHRVGADHWAGQSA